jgi:hypothetical protein
MAGLSKVVMRPDDTKQRPTLAAKALHDQPAVALEIHD